ncbi:MAG: DUF1003 domain-containing protein [Pseudomonadota bacterium]
MNHFKPLDYLDAASRWLGRGGDALGRAEHKVLQLAARRQTVTEDPNRKLDEQSTFGQRLADRVAAFGGSWTFISIFAAALLAWALINTELLGKTAFDPYPYIFLNLMLSMIAAMQAPIIMMSQQRQSVKDRQMAAHDYEVNLKAEIEIMALHEKIDALRSEHLMTLINQQQTQIDLLSKLLAQSPAR